MSILSWLGIADDEEAGTSVDSVGEIEKALSNLDPRQARYLACFAYILSRVARADHHVSDDESRMMEQIVSERGGIPAAQAALAVRIATSEVHHHRGTQDFLVSREFDRLASRDQKLALLDCLFAVSATDESILTVEDNEVRRVASELRLEHGDYIAVRTAHVHNLEVLRQRKPPS